MIRQFDVVANPTTSARDRAPYLVVLQSHYLYDLETMIVAPLVRQELIKPDNATSIAVEVGGETYTLDAGLMANIDLRKLGRAVANLAPLEYEIQRLLQRIFTGF